MDFLEFDDILNHFSFEENNVEFVYEYDKLQVGDIIWAKRYNDEEHMLKIPEGHRTGPYIVVGKDDNEIVCLYVTGIPPKRESFNYRTLILDNPNYSLDKISYVYIAKYTHISRDRFIRKLGYLTENDMKNLFKKMDIVNKEGMYVNMNINIPNIPLEVGDIIDNSGQLYLIVNETENRYQCVKMLDNSRDKNFFITLDGIRYSFNFSNLINYSKLFEPVRYNFLDNKTLHNVLIKYQERLNRLQCGFEIFRGSLIKIDDIYYYVYGEISNFWMAFAVFKKVRKNFCPLNIGKKRYYTDFSNTIQFSKEQKNIEIINLASEDEIKNIKECKKSYIKNLQSNNKKILSINDQKIVKEEIHSGSIVKFAKTYTGYLHVVIIRNNDELITIRYDKYLDGEYVLDCFFVEQMELWSNLNNFDLMQLLVDIRDKTETKNDKKRIGKIIGELEDTKIDGDDFSQEQNKFELVRKLIRTNK